MGFLSAAMGLVSLFGANKEAKAAKRAGKAQAAVDQRVTAEKIHMLKQDERTMAGDTRGLAAGSNVKADVGTPLTVLAEQAKRFARERKFTSEVGGEKAMAARQRGRDVASSAMYRGVGNALQSFGSAASTTAANRSSGQSWKKSFFGFG
jgi:hypothetical protein